MKIGAFHDTRTGGTVPPHERFAATDRPKIRYDLIMPLNYLGILTKMRTTGKRCEYMAQNKRKIHLGEKKNGNTILANYAPRFNMTAGSYMVIGTQG